MENERPEQLADDRKQRQKRTIMLDEMSLNANLYKD